MTDHTRAIEAGARALAHTFCDHWFGAHGQATHHKMTRDFVNGDDAWKEEATACIEAAIASGALVPASAVAEMRERCTKVADNMYSDIGYPVLMRTAGRVIGKEIRQLDTAPASGGYVVGWRDISTARKDRAPILAKFFDDIYPRIEPQRPDLESWNGLQVVIRHPGIPDSGFDMGWSVAAPVGNGGLPDKWIEGWKRLDLAPASGDVDFSHETFVADNGDGSIILDAYAGKTREELKQRCRDLVSALDEWQFAAMFAATEGGNKIENIREPHRSKIASMIEAYSDGPDAPPAMLNAASSNGGGK